MKNFIKFLIFSLFAINAYAQQATEIDSKSVRLPRYANLAAITNITTGITTPTQGMMVYNIETASNWYYNGTAWTNTLGAVSAPLNLNLSDIGGTTFTGIHTNSGAPGAPGGVGITGSSIGGEYGAGIFGLGTEANYGVRGHNSDFWGVFGTGLVGGVFQGATALRTSGALQFGGLGVGTISAGKVLTATDNLGNASWENLVPYSKTLNETSDLLRLTNIGTGGAGFFRINNSLNSNNAVHAATYGSGSAIYGLAENENGYAATFESVNGFPTLKSTNYENGNAGTFAIDNINSSGHTLLVKTNGLGRSGWFQSTNTANNSATIISENHGLGQAIYGTNFGTGKAGVFEINNGSNSNYALHALTNGSGKAAYFQGTNALETDGSIKFGGSGVGTIAAGKVLTSDALGNATWQSIPEITGPLNLENKILVTTNSSEYFSSIAGDNLGDGIGVIGVSSSGKGIKGFSTSGTGGYFYSSTGYALITGTGNVGIGTNTPTAKFEVAGFTKLGDDATAPKIKMKEITITTSSTNTGVSVAVAHGVTASKIIGISVIVPAGSVFIPPAYDSDPNLKYNYYFDATNVYIQNQAASCSIGTNICSKVANVVITYKQ